MSQRLSPESSSSPLPSLSVANPNSSPTSTQQRQPSPRLRSNRRVSRDRSRRFAMVFMAIMLLLSLLLGWGFAQVGQAQPSPTQPGIPQTASQPRTVDYVPQRHQLGQRLYLENCATCHIGVPPEVLPSEAWRNLLQDSSHYGTEITPPSEPSRGLIWAYLRGFSRSKSTTEERVPYRLARSRYFKALHPQVDLPPELSLQSCTHCHLAAEQFSFRPWTEPTAP